MKAFGRKFRQLREERNFTIRDIQDYFGFEAPQAIYKWQAGKSLPSTDNLLALSILFGVPMEEFLVYRKIELKNIPRDNSRGVFLFPCFSCRRNRPVRADAERRREPRQWLLNIISLSSFVSSIF